MAKAGPKRYVVCGDNHGDMCEPHVVTAFHEFCRTWKPEVRIHLGDCFDARFLRKKASEEEQREGIADDIEAGCDFLRKFKPTHFLRGNHDERCWDAAKSDDKPKAEFAYRLVEEIMEAIGDIPMLPYDKRNGVLKLGHLKIIHGYSAGITAARLAAQIYGSVLMGHLHAIDAFSVPGLERRIGRCIGALCKLNMDYNRGQANTLRQAHGWAYGLLFPNGDYLCYQAEEVGGRWFLPSEVRELSRAKKD